MKCPSCGYGNADDVLSCNLCGAVLARSARTPGTPTVRVKDPGLRSASSGRQDPPPVPPPAGPKHLLRPVGAPPISLEPGKTFTVGRAPDSSLPLPSGRVSRNHAEITWRDGKPVLADKGSSNGTFVGGKPIKEHELAPGDEIEIGPFFCTYVVEAEQQTVGPHDVTDKADVTQTIGAMSGLMTGRIEPATIAELLGTIELNQKTGTLDAFGPDGQGFIQVKEGQPLWAEFGHRKGEVLHTAEEAVFALLGLTSGRFTFMPAITATERKIRPTITGLLLEAGRRRDEAQQNS